MIQPSSLHLAEKCAGCHLFIESNGAKYLHLTRDDGSDESVDSTHEARPSGLVATLDTWKHYGPVEMRRRFADYQPQPGDDGQVYVTAIQHKHGDDITVAFTEQAAHAVVVSFADTWWDSEMGDRPRPEDPDDMIDAYFDQMADREFWSINAANLA